MGPSFDLYYYKVIGSSGEWKNSNITYNLNSPKDPIPAIYKQLGHAVSKEISQVFGKPDAKLKVILNEVEKASQRGINNILLLDRSPSVPSEMIIARNKIDALKKSSTSTNIKARYNQSIKSSKILSNAFRKYAQKFKQEVAGSVFKDVNIFNDFRGSEEEIKNIVKYVDRIDKNNQKAAYSVNKLQGAMFEFTSGAGMAMLDTFSGRVLPRSPFSNIRFSGHNKKADIRVEINISGGKVDLGFSIKSSIKSGKTEFKAHGGNMTNFFNTYPHLDDIMNKINIYSTNNGEYSDNTTNLKNIFATLLADPLIGGFEHGKGRSDMPERALVLINLQAGSAGHVSAKAQFLNKYFLSNPRFIRAGVGEDWFKDIRKSAFYGKDTKYYASSIT